MMYHLLEGGKENTVAFLGAGCSSVTQALAQASPFWNIPHFNFLSTSPTLDNRQRYPTYYHVLPTENGLNPGRVALMKSLHWKSAMILIETSDLFNLNANNLREEMVSAGLNQPELLILPQDNDFSGTLQQIKDADIRVLFGLFYEERGRRVVCELYRNGIHAPDHVWILPDWYHSKTWYLDGESGCKPEEMKEALDGYFAFDFAQLRPDVDKQLPTGKSVIEIAEEFQQEANISSNQSAIHAFQKYSAYGYDTVLAIAMLFHTMAEQLTKSGDIGRLNNFSYEDEHIVRLIREVLSQKNISFEGLTGYVQFYNLLSNDSEKREAEGYVEIRYYTQKERTCHLVRRYDNEANSLNELCPIPWTTNDGEPPVDIRPHRLMYSSVGIFVAIAVVTSIFLIITTVLILFNIHYRNHWLMKRSIPRLNEVILLGCLMLYSTVIVYGFDGQFFKFNSSSIACCYLRMTFLTIGFTFCYIGMLVKTCTQLVSHIIRKRFDNLIFVNAILIFGITLLADVVLLIIWFAVSPWKKTVKAVQDEGRAIFDREQCNPDDSWTYVVVLLVYKVVMLVIGIILTVIRIRLVKKRMEDSPYYDLISYSSGIGLCLATFGFVYVEDPGVEYALVSVSIILLVTCVLVVVFMKKVYIVLSGKAETRNSQGSFNDLAEIDRKELKELRTKSKSQRALIEKLLLEAR
jgi:gamma-aminobutyric acid type B receptor